MLKDQKYILVTGAPGSKWSSVVKNIYWSDDIDRTDYSKDREYYHEADTPGEPQLMHIGIRAWSLMWIIGMGRSLAKV